MPNISAGSLAAQIEDAVAAARAEERARAEQAMTEYRALVLSVAIEAKQENDWCEDGFLSALERLGLKLADRTVTVTIPVGPFATDEDAIEWVRENVFSSYTMTLPSGDSIYPSDFEYDAEES